MRTEHDKKHGGKPDFSKLFRRGTNVFPKKAETYMVGNSETSNNQNGPATEPNVDSDVKNNSEVIDNTKGPGGANGENGENNDAVSGPDGGAVVRAAAGAGMSMAFSLIYKVLAVVVTLMFIIITLLGLIDVLAAVISGITEKVKQTMNPYMMNKESTDYKTLQYLLNDSENEPFNVFLRQNIVNGIFKVVGIVIFLIAIQFTIFITMKIYSAVKRRPFTESIQLPMKYIGVIGVVFVATVILNALYKSKFINGVQPALRTTQDKMNEIKSYIYNNIYNDADFLAKLVSDDMESVLDTMKKYAQSRSNDALLRKMFFTMNLYNYFKSENESDPSFDDIKQMFTTEQIKKQQISPPIFLFYKQAAYIPNLYPSVRADFTKLLGTRERNFLANLSLMMKNLNKMLSQVQDIGAGKTKLNFYLWQTLLLCIVIAIILIIIFWRELQPLLTAISFLKAFLQRNTSQCK